MLLCTVTIVGPSDATTAATTYTWHARSYVHARTPVPSLPHALMPWAQPAWCVVQYARGLRPASGTAGRGPGLRLHVVIAAAGQHQQYY